LFLEEYLLPKYWDLPVTGHIGNRTENISNASLHVVSRTTVDSAPTESSRSIEQLNSNIILICLLLDGIEQCCLLLGTDFQLFLMDVLYPILEKIGSENANVSRSALLCIGSIATACGSGTVAGLLRDNADYLVDSISLRLRHVQRYPEAPGVLQVAIRYGDLTILPLVNDLMLEVRMFLCVFISPLKSQLENKQ
jgi:TELO2-interacting protein 1